MKSIYTLIPDINDLIKRKDGWFTSELSQSFATEMSLVLSKQLGEAHHSVGKQRDHLWFGELGPKCPRELWYRFHHPELAEPLPAGAEIKFTFGHILESLLITLAKAAGHHVVGEQDAMELYGVTGRRDCVIDGCLVDVKSSATRSFQKFKDGSIETDDTFGYLDQLDGYVCASAKDDLVTVKDRGYLLAIDKQLGHLALHEHRIRPDRIRERIETSKRIVALPTPPPCECRTVPDGKSGNVRLDTKASYSPYKWQCHPGLRCFLYASGPVYLTTVTRVPDVHEVHMDKRKAATYLQ